MEMSIFAYYSNLLVREFALQQQLKYTGAVL